ncbi:MAG: family four-helix-bundle protein [Flavipsychrobacter sp.]|jgi:uncharacterized protein (TIGR02284 family)|nr:family four-helix-bundle protein [Flavipsychrobacter sp.]
MEINEVVNDALNDLIMVNNDRIAGYEKSIEEAKDLDIDLKAMFRGMIEQSQIYKQELSAIIEKNAGIVEDDTSPSGKIYRAWMDIKATVTDTDRNTILEACEFGEDTTQRAYDAILSSGKILDEDVRKLVECQKNALMKSHDMIKTQKDAYEQIASHNH